MNEKRNLVDLHVHTTCSDGSYSPSDIVRLAEAYKLKAVAITDHNTMDGVEDCMFVASKTGLEVVAGVEISVDYKPELHVLGYFFDNRFLAFQTWLYDLRSRPDMVGLKVVGKLKELGYNIDINYVRSVGRDGHTNIPSIATALVKKKYFSHEREAIDKLLGYGNVAYFPFRPSIDEALTTLRQFGGIPVLAHPFVYGLAVDELEILIADMKNKGLMGIEVYHSDASSSMREILEDIANKYNLVKTGGSDFHGELKPGIEIGIGKNNLNNSYEIIERLKALSVK